MDNQTGVSLTRKAFLLHEWKFLLYVFFVLSMVLRLDATENKPNVGHRRVYENSF